MMPDEKDMKCRRGWATNHFLVDTSKPGGKAFVAAVEGVANAEDVNTKTVEEMALEDTAHALRKAYFDMALFLGPRNGDHMDLWKAVSRKAKALFGK